MKALWIRSSESETSRASKTFRNQASRFPKKKRESGFITSEVQLDESKWNFIFFKTTNLISLGLSDVNISRPSMRFGRMFEEDFCHLVLPDYYFSSQISREHFQIRARNHSCLSECVHIFIYQKTMQIKSKQIKSIHFIIFIKIWSLKMGFVCLTRPKNGLPWEISWASRAPVCPALFGQQPPSQPKRGVEWHGSFSMLFIGFGWFFSLFFCWLSFAGWFYMKVLVGACVRRRRTCMTWFVLIETLGPTSDLKAWEACGCPCSTCRDIFIKQIELIFLETKERPNCLRRKTSRCFFCVVPFRLLSKIVSVTVC